MDLKPRDFAGASADELVASSAPADVAELGIGKALGFTRSVRTTDTLCGAPSCHQHQLVRTLLEGRTYLCHGIDLDSAAHPAHSDAEHHRALFVPILERVTVFSPAVPAVGQPVLHRRLIVVLLWVYGRSRLRCGIVRLLDDVWARRARLSGRLRVCRPASSDEAELQGGVDGMDEGGDGVCWMDEG